MNKAYVYPLLALITMFLCECGKTRDPDFCGIVAANLSEPQELKILFIGNSHTYTYNIPETIQLMAEFSGDQLDYAVSAPGGLDFEQHYQFAPTLDAINSQNWDFVVLQESGWRTALPDEMAASMVYPFADSLAEIIRNNSASTEIVLFMTQGYREGVLTFNDEQWCEDDPQVCTYEGMQDRIHNTYLNLSGQLNADIAPAGAIWKIIMDKHEDINLFQADGVHASPEGSYVSACVIYSMIFRKRPEDIYAPANLNGENAIEIQSTVSDALFDCNPNWRL